MLLKMSRATMMMPVLPQTLCSSVIIGAPDAANVDIFEGPQATVNEYATRINTAMMDDWEISRARLMFCWGSFASSPSPIADSQPAREFEAMKAPMTTPCQP